MIKTILGLVLFMAIVVWIAGKAIDAGQAHNAAVVSSIEGGK